MLTDSVMMSGHGSIDFVSALSPSTLLLNEIRILGLFGTGLALKEVDKQLKGCGAAFPGFGRDLFESRGLNPPRVGPAARSIPPKRVLAPPP